MCRVNELETKTHDGGGRPPFPLVTAMSPDQVEYARQCLDYLLLGKLAEKGGEVKGGEVDNELRAMGEIIGFVKEFEEQQKKPAEEAFQLPR